MSARWRRPTEQGYTLMEVVVASVPLALIALLLFAVFGFTVAFSRRVEVKVEAVQQARMALHFIAQELREASAAPGAIVIWSTEEGAAQDGIGFLTARVDGPGRPFVTEPTGTPRWQHAVYYLRDHARGELRRLTAEPTTLAPPPSWEEGRLLMKCDMAQPRGGCPGSSRGETGRSRLRKRLWPSSMDWSWPSGTWKSMQASWMS